MTTLAVFLFMLIVLGLALSFVGGNVEVEPQHAEVFKNTISGNTHVLLAGTHSIKPWEKRLKTIELRNKPHDPPATQVKTFDPIEIGVDYAITDFEIPNKKEAVNLVFTKIEYDKRLENTIMKIRVFLQNAVGRRSFNAIYVEQQAEEKVEHQVNRDMVTKIEEEVNKELQTLLSAWGLIVKIQIHNLIVPQAVTNAMEDEVKARHAGKAIRKQADEIGDAPHAKEIIIARTLVDLFNAWKGGK